MRRLSCLAGAMLLLWPLIGCDSEDPTEIGEQTLDVSFAATNGVVNQFNVWDVFRDKNCLPDADPATPTPAELQCDSDSQCANIVGFSGVCGSDGVADDLSSPPDGTPDVFVYCEQALGTGGAPLQTTAPNTPWNFSVQIRVLRDGQTVQDVIATSTDTGDNLTPYDDTVAGGPPCPRNPLTGAPCPDPTSTFFYANGRMRSQSSREVTDAFLLINPSTMQQACPGQPLGDSGIDGTPLPISIRVNRGDTVIVDARKDNTPPTGFPIFSEPTLAALLTLDGSEVDADGKVVSEPQPGAGISFSFTVR